MLRSNQMYTQEWRPLNERKLCSRDILYQPYLKVGYAPVGDEEAATEEKAGSDVPSVCQRSKERNGTHLPVVAECGWAEQQPEVEGRQIAEGQEPAGEF